MHVKRSVILNDRLGPAILFVLWMKGQVLHLLRVQLKVPGDSSDFTVLLTKKSLTFLLRLNEMSGGSERMLPVSLSFWSNLNSSEWCSWQEGWVGEKWVWTVFSGSLPFVTFVVLSVGQLFGRVVELSSQLSQGSHGSWRTGAFLLICWKNPTHHYINVEVWGIENME